MATRRFPPTRSTTRWLMLCLCPENGLELYDDGLLAAELGLGYEWIDCDKQEVVAVTEGSL